MHVTDIVSAGRRASLALLVVLGLAAPAMAQTVPEQTEMDLWCGIAFTSLVATAPADASEADKLIIDALTVGGAELLEKAKAGYLEAGFTEEQFTTAQTDLTPNVQAQIQGTEDAADYTSDECSALIEMPEGM